MQADRFFPYHWYIDETERQVTCIRVYGLDSNNKNVCLRIDDFTPFAYLELPNNIDWTCGKEQLLGNKIDKECGVNCPLTKTVEFKKRLYGAHLDKHGNQRLFPYLKCTFSNVNDMKILGYKLRKPLNVIGCGVLHLVEHGVAFLVEVLVADYDLVVFGDEPKPHRDGQTGEAQVA